MLTKTEVKIMQVFVSKIAEKFSIKQVSEIIKKPYPLVHRSIKNLIHKRFISIDQKKLLSLNYKENNAELAYIEAIRRNEFIVKDKTLSLFLKDVSESINNNFFILLLFGSSIKNPNPRDIDLLFIVEKKNEIEAIEKNLKNIASSFSKKFDINVISIESAEEMLIKREEPNLINETLNNHLLLFGAENYYNILKNAR